MKEATTIWKNGEFIPWQDATTHVLSHALHYGTAVFEGIRAYETEKGPAIFRAVEHYNRLMDSAKLLYMPEPSYDTNAMIDVTKELILKNNLKSCYIRPIIYFGYGEMGLNPTPNKIETVIAAWEWGTYLGDEGIKNGIRCKISSYTRNDNRIVSPLSKTSANYLNSAYAKMEALRCGYDEGILLNLNGTISEGPGENIFVIKNGKIATPPASDQALQGINASAIIDIAESKGLSVEKRPIIRDELLLADELFFTGTAAEVTPIREIDGIQIGNGKRGPITESLQNAFFSIVRGKDSAFGDWLTYCN